HPDIRAGVPRPEVTCEYELERLAGLPRFLVVVERSTYRNGLDEPVHHLHQEAVRIERVLESAEESHGTRVGGVYPYELTAQPVRRFALSAQRSARVSSQ